MCGCKKQAPFWDWEREGLLTGFFSGIVLTEGESCRATESERESNGRWKGNLVNYTAKSPCHLLLSLSAPFLLLPVASSRREENRGPGHGGPSMSFYDPGRMYGPESVQASPMTSQRESPIWGPLFEVWKPNWASVARNSTALGPPTWPMHGSPLLLYVRWLMHDHQCFGRLCRKISATRRHIELKPTFCSPATMNSYRLGRRIQMDTVNPVNKGWARKPSVTDETKTSQSQLHPAEHIFPSEALYMLEIATQWINFKYTHQSIENEIGILTIQANQRIMQIEILRLIVMSLKGSVNKPMRKLS